MCATSASRALWTTLACTPHRVRLEAETGAAASPLECAPKVGVAERVVADHEQRRNQTG